MNRKTAFVPENYFHIYNRGIEKRNIFLDYNDYRRFLVLLYLCNNTEPVDLRNLIDNKGLTFEEMFNIKRKEILVDIGSYCLLPNHIHVLIKPRIEKGVSLFMQKLFTAYTMYFNKKNIRTGRLFESTFKAKIIERDEHLKYLFAYIHLNPVKLIEPEWKENGIKNFDKAKKFLNNYGWSSYLSYLQPERNDSLLSKKSFPEYFDNAKEFNDFIDEWLKYQEFAKV